MNMAKRKKQSTPQSVKKDDVFKVKNKSSKKSKTASIKVLKAKSVSDPRVYGSHVALLVIEASTTAWS